MSGQESHRADVLSISNAFPCVLTTTEAHGYSTGSFIRLTDLNGMIPVPRGQNPLNNNRWKIIVTGLDSFELYDPIRDIPVDSTDYPPYVEGGYCNLIETIFIYEG